MQSRFPLFVATLFALTAVAVKPAFASGPDDKPFDQDSINALQVRILQAQPREQCFLYAQLVHQMTEVSLRHYAAGDADKAVAMLRQVQDLSHKIHLSVTDDNRRLKDAEILLRHTAFRLTEMLHDSNLEDQPLVAATLAQVNQAQTDAMLQVFRK